MRPDLTQTPAVVLGASVNGLSFARSLGRRGVPVLLLDSKPEIGLRTRCAETRLLPQCGAEPEAWLECLFSYADRVASRPVLFATSDVHSVFLASHLAELEDRFHLLLPDLGTLEAIVNKRMQYGIAERAGIPIPATYFPESVAELGALLDRIPFPCILKPYRAHVGRPKIGNKKVAVCQGPEELRSRFTAVSGQDACFMVQEIIPGGDGHLYGYLALWGRDSKELCWVTKRKLRQNPPLFGDGSFQATVDAPDVLDAARRLLAEFRYRGFVGVEFKRDPRADCLRLMEINPRTVSGTQMAITAGVDFPWIGYRYLLDGDINGVSPHARAGVLYVNEEWDLKAFLAMRRQGTLTTAAWLRSFRSAEARAIFAWDDPGPALTVLKRILAAMFRRLLGRA